MESPTPNLSQHLASIAKAAGMDAKDLHTKLEGTCPSWHRTSVLVVTAAQELQAEYADTCAICGEPVTLRQISASTTPSLPSLP